MPRACLLLPLLALAGCGGAAAAHGPGDAQIARRAGLTLSDLPSGWRTRKPKRLVDCPAFRAARGTASASARSPVFMSHDDTKELSGTVEVYASRQAARGAFLRLTAPGSRGCVARTLRRTVPGMAGIRVRGVTDFVTRVDPLGDEQAGSRFAVAYATARGQGVFYIDMLVVRAGRGIATESYTSDSAPLDGGLRYNLTALTARRLAGELGG